MTCEKPKSGYTTTVKNAHIATAVVMALLGLAIILFEYFMVDPWRRRIIIGLGVVFLLAGLLSLWPIVKKQTCNTEEKSCCV